MRTRVEVISMATATDRRAQFIEAARAARSEWTFVDAASSAPPGVPHDPVAATRRFGRPLTGAEIGCFASHWHAWSRLLQSSDEQRIVLEDDVIVDWHAIDPLGSVDFSAHGLDLVRFYSTHPFSHRTAITRFSSPHRHLVQTRGMFLGSQGYVLTRRAAQRLVQCVTAIAMPVDWYMGRYWELGFPNYCLFPFPVIERETPSHIGDRPEPSVGGRDRLLRLGWRLRDRLEREVADLRSLGRRFEQHPDFGPTFIERHRTG